MDMRKSPVIGVLPSIPSAIRGLIFDCDGTIADTMPLHYQSWVGALARYERTLSEARFYALAGVPTVRMVEMFSKEGPVPLPVQEVADLKESLYERLLPQAPPIASVVDIIRANAGKRPMAVASGGTRYLCTLVLQELGLLSFFDALVTCEDVERAKPAPDVFLKAAERIGIPPAECLVYEDADLGIEAAEAAGMHAVDIRLWAQQAESVSASLD